MVLTLVALRSIGQSSRSHARFKMPLCFVHVIVFTFQPETKRDKPSLGTHVITKEEMEKLRSKYLHRAKKVRNNLKEGSLAGGGIGLNESEVAHPQTSPKFYMSDSFPCINEYLNALPLDDSQCREETNPKTVLNSTSETNAGAVPFAEFYGSVLHTQNQDENLKAGKTMCLTESKEGIDESILTEALMTMKVQTKSDDSDNDGDFEDNFDDCDGRGNNVDVDIEIESAGNTVPLCSCCCECDACRKIRKESGRESFGCTEMERRLNCIETCTRRLKLIEKSDSQRDSPIDNRGGEVQAVPESVQERMKDNVAEEGKAENSVPKEMFGATASEIQEFEVEEIFYAEKAKTLGTVPKKVLTPDNPSVKQVVAKKHNSSHADAIKEYFSRGIRLSSTCRAVSDSGEDSSASQANGPQTNLVRGSTMSPTDNVDNDSGAQGMSSPTCVHCLQREHTDHHDISFHSNYIVEHVNNHNTIQQRPPASCPFICCMAALRDMTQLAAQQSGRRHVCSEGDQQGHEGQDQALLHYRNPHMHTVPDLCLMRRHTIQDFFPTNSGLFFKCTF